MGMKHFARYGLYVLKGSINVQLAEKTEFTTEDADVIKGMPAHTVHERRHLRLVPTAQWKS